MASSDDDEKVGPRFVIATVIGGQPSKSVFKPSKTFPGFISFGRTAEYKAHREESVRTMYLLEELVIIRGKQITCPLVYDCEHKEFFLFSSPNEVRQFFSLPPETFFQYVCGEERLEVIAMSFLSSALSQTMQNEIGRGDHHLKIVLHGFEAVEGFVPLIKASTIKPRSGFISMSSPSSEQ